VRSPQIVVFEKDGRLRLLLEKTAEERRWALRESRQVEPCLRLLAEGEPSVLVIKAGRDLERELSLLERAAWAFPAVATVLVGDGGQAALVGLAWDLGAAFVLTPPQPREQLPEIVAALMPDVREA
jgi:DNA-binding NtrC family response regulator